MIELADAMADTSANTSDELHARLRGAFQEETIVGTRRAITFESYCATRSPLRC